MMRKGLLIAFMLLAPLGAVAQQVRLRVDTAGTALYLDIDRVWCYNLYEHSRWGAGLTVENARKGLAVSVWGGYGVEDMEVKGGVALRGRGPAKGWRWKVGVSRDYEGAGSRRMASGNVFDPGTLAAFMTRRMSDRHTVTLSASKETAGVENTATVRLFHGWRLYDGSRLLYRMAGDELPREDGAELQLTMHKGGLTVSALGAMMKNGAGGVRLLGEYEREWRLPLLTPEVYVQGGMAAPGSGYHWLFDLGGTMGAPLCFERTLLTAAPNEFTTSVFTLLSARLSTSRPLWRVYSRDWSVGSVAVPFVQLTAAWGTLWGEDSDGRLVKEGMLLQAPVKGIAEAVAGVEGLVRWGAVDWGAAVAWRLTPESAVYHRTETDERLAVMLTARLAL